MADQVRIRIPRILWETIQERAFDVYGISGQEKAFLSLLLQGNANTSATKLVAALEKPINKKNLTSNRKGKKFLYPLESGGTEWVYDKKEIDDIFFIYEQAGGQILNIANALLFPNDKDLFTPDEELKLEAQAERLKELVTEWRKER